MTGQSRSDRLWQEANALKLLEKQSTIFSCQCHGEPPNEFVLEFHGRGLKLAGDSSATAGQILVEDATMHQVRVEMAYLYPDREPDLKWCTPVFHPNISSDDFVDLKSLGMTWDPKMSMVIICERIWDLIRLAYLDLDKASPSTVKDWFGHQCSETLPLDSRSLRDKIAITQSNIVKYQRKTRDSAANPASTKSGEVSKREVLFIGDDEVSEKDLAAKNNPPSARDDDRDRDDEIMFIE